MLQVKGGPDRNASASDSVAKLQVVLDICRRLGVHTSPKQLGQLWIAPVLAWHHRCFDTEPDVPGVPRASAMTVAVSCTGSACTQRSHLPARLPAGAVAWHACLRVHPVRQPVAGLSTLTAANHLARTCWLLVR